MCPTRTKSGIANVRPLPWRRESRLVLGLGLGAVLIFGAFLPGAHGAAPGHPGPTASLKQRQAGLSSRSQRALLGLYALDSRLLRARGDLGRLQTRAAALRLEQQRVRHEIAVVEGTLRASQRLLGDRLRTLYEEGEPNAIAILLGASSLDDAVTRLNELDRRTLKEAFRIARELQSRLALDYQL